MADEELIDRIYRTVGSRVRDVRTESRKTQEALAASLGVTRSSIANLEAGRQRIPLHRFIFIALALDVPISALLRDSDFTAASLLEATDLHAELANVADDTRDFIRGALAQVYSQEPEEAP